MTREEFLRELNENLNGNVSDRERNDSVQYYREYIEEEIRGGKSEDEIMESLGSAYGIAKSIIEAKGNGAGGRYEDQGVYEEETSSSGYEPEKEYSRKSYEVSRWKIWLIVAAIIFVVIMLLSVVFKAVAVLLPVLIVFFVLKLIIDFIKGR